MPRPVPSVSVIQPIRGMPAVSSLQSARRRLEAFSRAPIFRAGQRLPEVMECRYWRARSKPGQVLAEIETPELDQQLLQARADLAER
jgi:hypothetical protein